MNISPPENTSRISGGPPFKAFLRPGARRSSIGHRAPRLFPTSPLSPTMQQQPVVLPCRSSFGESAHAKAPMKSKKNIVKGQKSPSSLEKKKAVNVAPSSPEEFFESLLQKRGYGTTKYNCLETAYFNTPTPLQVASYDNFLLDLVNKGDTEQQQVADILGAGISPNPTSVHSESLLHAMCRHPQPALLATFLQAGASVQVADDKGRTVLHDACWRLRVGGGVSNQERQNAFALVRQVLDQDTTLLHLQDAHGATPLAYVPRCAWSAWKQWLWQVRDVYWPIREGTAASKKSMFETNELLRCNPNTRPLPDPVNALEIPLTRLLVAGRLALSDVAILKDSAEIFHDNRTLPTSFFSYDGKNDTKTGDDQDEGSTSSASNDGENMVEDSDVNDFSCSISNEKIASTKTSMKKRLSVESLGSLFDLQEMEDVLQSFGSPATTSRPLVSWSPYHHR